MRLTVLSVGFPFAPVTPDPVGGAERVLSMLDRALVRAGHRSLVIAPEGSEVSGELIAITGTSEVNARTRALRQAEVREKMAAVLSREQVDVVHLHGLDFDAYLPPPGPPLLVTLHLPLDWYASGALRPGRPHTALHPVSYSQIMQAGAGHALSEPIENGVEPAPAHWRKGRFALALGRICPEKGFEDALDAAARAGMPFLLAGTVFPYAEHRDYFSRSIAPRLGRGARWVGAVAGLSKQRLLARAACLLVPSKVPETSSLVAMEALAAGTPVIAYRIGALPDIVEDGVTGFLVDTVDEMAQAMAAVGRIDPEMCRRRAAERFSADAMIARYFRRYAELAGEGVGHAGS